MKEHLEERILLYSQLPPDERLALDMYVEMRPELAPLLAEAKALDVLLTEARQMLVEPPPDEALAYFVATRYMAQHPLPEGLREVFANLEAQIWQDPELRGRVQELDRRIREIEKISSDPAAQFERLSGYSLPAEAPPAPVSPPPSVPASDRAARPPAQPPAQPTRRRPRSAAGRVLVRVVAVVLVMLGIYGLLLLGNRTTMSDLERLATIDPQHLEVEGFGVPRSSEATLPAASGAASPDAIYLRALSTLREARTSTLGLFPRYDYEKLAEAAALLEQVVAGEPDSARTFLELESFYFLGKIRLAQGQVPEATRAFEEVVAGRGRNAREAAEILRVLERERAAAPPGSRERPL